MKFSLSNLLLFVALLAVLLGWFYDHRRLRSDKERLNSEAAGLCNMVSMMSHGGSGGTVLPPGRTSATRPYSAAIEEDRAEILKSLPAPWASTGSMYDAV